MGAADSSEDAPASTVEAWRVATFNQVINALSREMNRRVLAIYLPWYDRPVRLHYPKRGWTEYRVRVRQEYPFQALIRVDDAPRDPARTFITSVPDLNEPNRFIKEFHPTARAAVQYFLDYLENFGLSGASQAEVEAQLA